MKKKKNLKAKIALLEKSENNLNNAFDKLKEEHDTLKK